MPAVPVTIAAVIYPKNKTVKPYSATIVGYAWVTGLEVGGGPITPPPDLGTGNHPAHPIVLPGDPSWGDPHPAHPIELPPVDVSPPDEIPITPPDQGKPPPPEGGWGWHPVYGWGWFPGPGQAGPKK